MASHAWGEESDGPPTTRSRLETENRPRKRRQQTNAFDEDKYLRLKDKHIKLQLDHKQQDENITILSTKLAKLTADLETHKRLGERKEGVTVKQIARKRDRETESLVDDLRLQVKKLKRANEAANKKVEYWKGIAQSKRGGQYGRVQPRTDTGRLPKGLVPALNGKQPRDTRRPDDFHSEDQPRRTRGDSPTQQPPPPPTSNDQAYTELVKRLEEAEGRESDVLEENRRHQHAVAVMRGHLVDARADCDKLRVELHALRHSNAEYERVTHDARDADTERERRVRDQEIELVKMHQEVKSRANQIAVLTSNYARLEGLMRGLQENERLLSSENDNLKAQLKRERESRSKSTETSIKVEALEIALAEQKIMTEEAEERYEARNADHKALLSNTIFGMKDKEHAEVTRGLQSQLEELQVLLKKHQDNEEGLLNKLQVLQDTNAELRSANVGAIVTATELEEKNSGLLQTLETFNDLNPMELREALAFIRSRQEGKRASAAPDFVDHVGEIDRDAVDMASAQLVEELEKANILLEQRARLNQEMKEEKDALTRDMDLMRADYEEQLSAYALQIDRKNEKIRKLQEHIYQVSGKIMGRQKEPAPEDDVALEDDENLFVLTIEAAELDGKYFSSDAETFVTTDFYEHETAMTPVLRGLKPAFNSVSMFIMTVDDFFFSYLQTSNLILEVHRARGMDYVTEGSAIVSFEELLRDKRGDELMGMAPIYSTDGQDVTLGKVKYSIRMVRPMTEAISLQRQREDFLTVVDPSRTRQHLALRTAGRQAALAKKNTLTIKLKTCQLNNAGSSASPVAFYQFFDIETYRTMPVEQIDENGMFVFNDEKSYPVACIPALHDYLRNRLLEITVFDAVEADDGKAFYGSAMLELRPLASNKSIELSATLLDLQDEQSGTLSVEVSWVNNYEAPVDKHKKKKEESEDDDRLGIDEGLGAFAPTIAKARAARPNDAPPAVDHKQAVSLFISQLDIVGDVHKQCKGQLQVLFKFLGQWVPAEPLTTITGVNPSIVFNMKKVFHIPYGSDARKLFKEEVKFANPERQRDGSGSGSDSEEEDEGLIELSIVDYVKKDTKQSTEIGVAYVSLKQIWQSREDLSQFSTVVIPLDETRDDEIAHLVVSTHTLDAIDSIIDEENWGTG